MKAKSSIFCCALLSALSAVPVSARLITVRVTGHVTGVSGALGGNVQLNQPITGTYTYDTITFDGDPSSNGHYQPAVTRGTVQINIGALQFQSAPTSQYTIYVNPGVPNSRWGRLELDCPAGAPLANGAAASEMWLTFVDQSGQLPTSDALPAVAPDLTHFTSSQILVSGANTQNTGAFNIYGQIDSAALVPTPMEVSPADGDFVRQQNIDAALLLPAGAQWASVQATVAGRLNPVIPSVGCYPAQANSENRPVILCPGAQGVFPPAVGGLTQVDWQVTLRDGTVLTQSSHWNLIQ